MKPPCCIKRVLRWSSSGSTRRRSDPRTCSFGCAAGLCHTDLEVIDGSLRYPMPIVLGHEAAGVVEEVGAAVTAVRRGDHVILSWNPHCGHCFYCDRGVPILCEDYLAKGPQAVQFDGQSKAHLTRGGALKHLMFVGAFGD